LTRARPVFIFAGVHPLFEFRRYTLNREAPPMRILTHYLLAVAILTIYGGQV